MAGVPLRSRGDREELFRALLRQIIEPAAFSVIVIEDIHWADEATLDLLRFLARRVRNTSVLLIATYRDDELDRMHPLRVVLGELSRGSLDRMTVAPLSNKKLVRDLVTEIAPPAERFAVKEK